MADEDLNNFLLEKTGMNLEELCRKARISFSKDTSSINTLGELESFIQEREFGWIKKFRDIYLDDTVIARILNKSEAEILEIVEKNTP